MPCRHDMSRTARRKIIAINVGVLALKLTELAVFIGEHRRRREASKVLAAAAATALVEKHFPLKKENKS